MIISSNCLPPLLPINDISKWLHEPLEQKCREQERFLLIEAIQIQNVDKMIDLLKTVFSNFNVKLAPKRGEPKNDSSDLVLSPKSSG